MSGWKAAPLGLTPEEIDVLAAKITARAIPTFGAQYGGLPCLLYSGERTARGYSLLTYGRSTYRAHRLVLSAVLGREVQTTMTVDHLCGSTSCVRPGHLAEVTAEENSGVKARHREQSLTRQSAEPPSTVAEALRMLREAEQRQDADSAAWRWLFDVIAGNVVEEATACWRWTGPTVPLIGGRPVWADPSASTGRQVYMDRTFYEVFVGPLGEVQVRRGCSSPNCLNPGHMTWSASALMERYALRRARRRASLLSRFKSAADSLRADGLLVIALVGRPEVDDTTGTPPTERA
jgi:hypothetical protein